MLTMSTVHITGGPAKDELLSRMLSNLPVTLLMTSRSVEVLIEEMQETDESGVRLLFFGQIVAGTDVGARVEAHYDCLRKNCTLAISTDRA
jgi:hypothetical protein